jgi:hypothetical protein
VDELRDTLRALRGDPEPPSPTAALSVEEMCAPSSVNIELATSQARMSVQLPPSPRAIREAELPTTPPPSMELALRHGLSKRPSDVYDSNKGFRNMGTGVVLYFESLKSFCWLLLLLLLMNR